LGGLVAGALGGKHGSPGPSGSGAGAGAGASSGGGGGAQDKIIALAMAQAGKLFDKKNGGGGGGGGASGAGGAPDKNAAKMQAMQSAGLTAMKLMGQYKSTGKVDLEPGEMQKLIGAAMSFI